MKKVSIKQIPNESNLKVLHISGDANDVLENHKVNHKALILVRRGEILYKEGNKQIILSGGESHDIPVDVFHSVVCQSESAFFVIMNIDTKMKFQPNP